VTDIVLALAELRIKPDTSWLKACTSQLDALGYSMPLALQAGMHPQASEGAGAELAMPEWRVRALHRALRKLSS